MTGTDTNQFITALRMKKNIDVAIVDAIGEWGNYKESINPKIKVISINKKKWGRGRPNFHISAIFFGISVYPVNPMVNRMNDQITEMCKKSNAGQDLVDAFRTPRFLNISSKSVQWKIVFNFGNL